MLNIVEVKIGDKVQSFKIYGNYLKVIPEVKSYVNRLGRTVTGIKIIYAKIVPLHLRNSKTIVQTHWKEVEKIIEVKKEDKNKVEIKINQNQNTKK